MNRSQRVVEVYRELRQELAWASSGDLLACAASLVELWAREDEPHFDTHVGPAPYEEWAVDAAFADGGWRVLARETAPCDYEPEDEDCRFARTVRQLEWRGVQ